MPVKPLHRHLNIKLCLHEHVSTLDKFILFLVLTRKTWGDKYRADLGDSQCRLPYWKWAPNVPCLPRRRWQYRETADSRKCFCFTDVNIHGWRIGVDVCRRVVSFKSTAEQQLHRTENWCPCKKWTSITEVNIMVSTTCSCGSCGKGLLAVKHGDLCSSKVWKLVFLPHLKRSSVWGHQSKGVSPSVRWHHAPNQACFILFLTDCTR